MYSLNVTEMASIAHVEIHLPMQMAIPRHVHGFTDGNSYSINTDTYTTSEGTMEGQEVIGAVGGLVSLAVVSYLIAIDANKKGRSGIAWGLLCFFTCFIAIPVYFLLSTQEKEK